VSTITILEASQIQLKVPFKGRGWRAYSINLENTVAEDRDFS
jgi:hypothetical protein